MRLMERAMSGAEQSPRGGGRLSLAATTGVMVAAVIAFFLLFLVLFFLYLRSKRYWGAIPVSPAARRLVSAPAIAAPQRPGLDAAALPPADLKGGIECAVCLCDLSEGGNAARLLPDCGHAFHLECIDIWFHAHATCPLCRSVVAPEKPQIADAGAARPDSGESLQLSSDPANGGRAGFPEASSSNWATGR